MDLGRAVVQRKIVEVSKVCQPSLGGVTAIIQTLFEKRRIIICHLNV